MDRRPGTGCALTASPRLQPTRPAHITSLSCTVPVSKCFVLSVPLDCRVLVWHHVLCAPYTRLERWRPPYNGPSAWARGVDTLDADFFPYRLVSAGGGHQETPLALLLCCRQVHFEALKILYSSTTFVFAMPRDLRGFQVLASPTGVKTVRGIFLVYGRVDWRGNGPLHDTDGKSLREWEDAFRELGNKVSLRELQIWLSHRNDEPLDEARRPWAEGSGDERAENRHQGLFDVFRSVSVPDFTVRLTWNPKDILDQQDRPFKVKLQTADAMVNAKKDLPRPTKPDICD
jgi:hypothetical protein